MLSENVSHKSSMPPEGMPAAPLQVMRMRPKTAQLTPAETIRRIESFIRNPPDTSRVFKVTPEVAEHLLQYNIGNRSKKSVQIAQYARDMSRGDWRETGETIKFSDAGKLRDGQNRLMACVQSGASFVTHFVFGVPDQSFAKMDQGKIRTGGDVLQIAGYTDVNNLAAAVRWAHLFHTNRVKQRDTYNASEILELMRDQYDDGGIANFVKIAGRSSHITGQPKGQMAGLFYHLHTLNPEKAMEWITAWENGLETGKYRSISLAKKKIAEIKTLSSNRMNEVVRMALLIKAWNMFMDGGRCRKEDMNYTLEESFPEIRTH